MIDKAARELGVDPIALRRQNFITEEFPYDTPVAVTYDTGDYHATHGQALEMIDYAGFENAPQESEARGKLRGYGLQLLIEACGIAPSNLVGQLGARAGLYDPPPCGSTPPAITVMTGATATGRGMKPPLRRWWPI